MKAPPAWTWLDPLTKWSDAGYTHWGVNATDGSQVRHGLIARCMLAH